MKTWSPAWFLCTSPQISFCASDGPAAGYQCSRLPFIFCINPKFWSICNFCNKELKLCLLYVFFKNVSTCFWWDVAGLCISYSFNLRYFYTTRDDELNKKVIYLISEIWLEYSFLYTKWNILRSVSYLTKLCKLWNPSDRVGGTLYMAQLPLVLDGSTGATLVLATICFKLYLFEIYCPTFPSVLPIVSQWVQNSWSLNVSPARLEFRSWETVLSISLLDQFLRNLTQWMLLWRHH